MPFEIIPTKTVNKNITNPDKVQIASVNGPRGGTPLFRVRIGANITKRLGIQKTGRADAYLGTGKDEGKYRFIFSSERKRYNSRPVRVTKLGNAIITADRVPEWWNSETMNNAYVEYQIHNLGSDNQTLTITLPKT